MRIIIMGCGPLVSTLLSSGNVNSKEVAIIGDDIGFLEDAANTHGVNAVAMVDPWLQDYLQQAGINNTQLFLALTDDDHWNALNAQIAKHIFNVPTVVCRLENIQLQQLYTDLGMQVVSPTLGLLQDLGKVFSKLPD